MSAPLPADSAKLSPSLKFDSSCLWKGEHFFSVSKDVPGKEMVRLSGDYLTGVFEGPYRDEPEWEKEMQEFVKSRGKRAGAAFNN